MRILNPILGIWTRDSGLLGQSEERKKHRDKTCIAKQLCLHCGLGSLSQVWFFAVMPKKVLLLEKGDLAPIMRLLFLFGVGMGIT